MNQGWDDEGWVGANCNFHWTIMVGWIRTINMAFCSDYNVPTLFFKICKIKMYLIYRENRTLQTRYSLWSTVRHSIS